MELYPDLCQLVRDNKLKVTNMQTWSHIQIHVSDNMHGHGVMSRSMGVISISMCAHMETYPDIYE